MTINYLFEIINLQDVLVLHCNKLVDIPLLVTTSLIERGRPDLEPKRHMHKNYYMYAQST